MTTDRLITTDGKAAALEALRFRRANKPAQKDNNTMPAGSPMYFYCKACAHVADVLPENFVRPPSDLCRECQALKDLGWLE